MMLMGHVALCDLFLTEENTTHPEKLSFFGNYGNCSVIRKACIQVVSCLFVVLFCYLSLSDMYPTLILNNQDL